ncbi:DUF4166 domain-containing protein [Luteimonas sp. BDR2-5]|uniref:DUF4166 domain-containing protein n=1 Tax=Proluteimonas luteida TaxID=2878685 RepID=UPI001E41632B|nr:DUF4166 domain-containing protein [Luteimonas sp. BDR2-5]MCD9027016.1 DUF4166 domain-containing protein [Luteimonas sp. BDR2-5]
MTPTLFQTVLGAPFFRLPETLRALHSVRGDARYAGRASIQRGRGLLARLCGRVAGLPAAMDDVPVTVDFVSGPSGEVWLRSFGTAKMRSRLWHHGGELRERLGPVQLRFALHTWDGMIFWNTTGIRVLGVVPLPARLVADVRCREREHEGRYEFLVEARLPVVGQLIRYEGWLAPV